MFFAAMTVYCFQCEQRASKLERQLVARGRKMLSGYSMSLYRADDKLTVYYAAQLRKGI